jgi:tRNA A-37 threonylcarbamoyl transferase component Bud32
VLVGRDDELHLVDFHRARLSSSARARRADVLALGHRFLAGASAGERLRFCRGYGDEAARWLEPALRSRLAFQLHHEKRCDGAGRAFERVRLAGARGVARREPEAAALVVALERLGGRDPAAIAALARAHGRLVHEGGAAQLWRVDLPGLAAPLAFKLFDDRGPLKRLLRGSRARRAWRNLFRLEMAGVPTARALLFLEGPALSLAPRSLLVARFVDDAAPPAPGLPAARELELARLLARLHDEGLSHRDLKAENFLVPRDAGPIRLVDGDGVRRRRRVDPEVAARDLMRLNASFPDLAAPSTRRRLAFLAAYRRARRLEPPGLDLLARAIARRTAAKWRATQR